MFAEDEEDRKGMSAGKIAGLSGGALALGAAGTYAGSALRGRSANKELEEATTKWRNSQRSARSAMKEFEEAAAKYAEGSKERNAALDKKIAALSNSNELNSARKAIAKANKGKGSIARKVNNSIRRWF